MNSGKALDYVINHFDLQAKQLAELSGVAAETISRYRNNSRDIKADNLVSILRAMPSEARHMYVALVADELESIPLPKVA
ncbi:helix-turn-helix transcriptional regulator [Pseudanabaena sp. 'Roaring Creek']|uniref:helix-turn-helix domain-containing protein n=1 Tax=Pseudanabaena sp. 'Roaring Creek' TaxID=1681830 RepID=UPI0006D81D0C